MLKEARDGAGEMGKFLSGVPSLLAQAEHTALALGDMARSGVHLDEDSVERIAGALARQSRSRTFALWIGALSMLALVALVALRWLG